MEVEELEKVEKDPQVLLNEMLNSLYDLGGSQEQSRSSRSGKKKTKSPEKSMEKENNEDADCRAANAEQTASSGKAKSKITSAFLRRFKEEFLQQCDSADVEPVTTDTGSSYSSTSVPEEKKRHVEVVRFHNPHERKKNRSENNPEPDSKVKEKMENQKISAQEFNFEKARLEVHRFGITGYRKEEQRMLEQERAIMLGAKPPKREYVNYKTYQEIAKQKKREDREDSNVEAKSELSQKRKRKDQDGRKTKKKKSAAVLQSGQIGRFKNGTLILSGKEIQKIQTSKVRK